MRHRGELAGTVLLALALTACNGADVRETPEEVRRAPELAGAPPPRVDFWSESLGDYLGPEFRTTPEEERFARFGRQLLEYRMREDLLAEHRWALSQQDIDTFSGQPDYDSSQRFLEVLGVESSDAVAPPPEDGDTREPPLEPAGPPPRATEPDDPGGRR